MQALCSQCSQKIVIDDAKVPDRPFSVRCPKCQAIVKLAGKGAAPEAPAALPLAPVPAGAPPPPVSAASSDGSGRFASDDLRGQMMAQLRREMTGDASGPQALVAFPDLAPAGAIGPTLGRLGYSVENVADFESGARLLEQGAYQLVATARVASAPGRPESLFQRMVRLSPDQRRRIFVILVGDEFKTGDGTQAFLVMADLVLNSKDAASADAIIRATIAERKRLYQVFDEAHRKFEATGA